MMDEPDKAVPWSYFTWGKVRAVIRATPATVEVWHRAKQAWVPTGDRPESVFTGNEYDPISPERAAELTTEQAAEARADKLKG